MAFLLTLLLTTALLPLLRRFALDVPNERSSHSAPVARGGGIGFVIIFFFLAVANSASTSVLWLLPLAIVGLWDDLRGLSISVRFPVQIGVAAALVVSSPSLHHLALSPPHVLAFLLLMGVTLSLINFYNFMDGIDGLVAGCTLLQLIAIAQYFQGPLYLAECLGAFLLFNWQPARLFMGDAGSTFLGGYIAWCALNVPEVEAFPPVFVVALPFILDPLTTLVRRLRNGENLLGAHKQHLYQRLVSAGVSHRVVTSIYMGLTALLAVISRAHFSWLFAVTVAVAACILGEAFLIRQNRHEVGVKG